ncbi:MAG: PTS sugar transporter subunit IIA [Ignavibacteriae bacterium HGW-Ignavibacteriae-2]|jgi:fructose-specific phosphotransferase system IIA component|nr:PTS sugar transporter subunit IIA [Bacteroidota bacterium]PKL90380.1 MAG: PTS sugar transporter subunit IIA [Ignavibacteriae bacterium HGW-Ignavibacteriae-2]
MKICDVLQKDKIIMEFKSLEKDDVINQLIDLFKGDERVNDLEKLRESVFEREKIMSTGVGNGFAIPHAKTSGVSEMIAGFGKLSEPIEFEALDNQPVNMILLLVGEQNAVSQHIKMLSRVSRLMNKESFRNSLLNAKTPEQIYSIFEEEEKNFLEIN